MPLAFTPSRGRGRPRKTACTETGTPELVMKRALQVTGEAIDLCHERGFITDSQHWCGLHLRWLHTIRFGAPGISAYNLLRVDNWRESEEDDPRWRSAREMEYQQAIQLLQSIRCLKPVMSVCIYNERPSSLIPARQRPATTQHMQQEISGLQEGLTALTREWKRTPG